jgi:hypothetical protein
VDLAAVIAAAAARCATLHALDTGVTISPDAAGALVADQIAAFGKVVREPDVIGGLQLTLEGCTQ